MDREREAHRVLAVRRAPVEHGLAHLKNWRTVTKLRTDPARATRLLRAPARTEQPRSQQLTDVRPPAWTLHSLSDGE